MILLLAACLFLLLAPVGCLHSKPDPKPDPNLVIPAIVPLPARIERTPGEFEITKETKIVVEAGPAGVRETALYLAEWIRSTTGYKLPVEDSTDGRAPRGSLVLTTSGADPSVGPEGYELIATPWLVTLRAPEPRGLFYGVQTIRQLLPPHLEEGKRTVSTRRLAKIPCVTISDQPRFAWRGMLLDCCRHFMPKEIVKRTIDLLAYHKMNVFHWHLTEDQGWRIEIKKYPKLTEVGAWRKSDSGTYGGFYTQEDIREVVAHAASRHVTVVPEIEMPGHSTAAVAAYPELSCTGGPFEVETEWGVFEDVYCAGNEKTFQFMEDVLSEVVDLFPGSYIHVGGDECPKTRWKECDKCQARIVSEGIADEHALQSYFIRRIEKFLQTKDRRIIGWDEILEGGLAPGATVQSWRGMDGAIAAARMSHDVIVSPTSHCYLDYPQEPDPDKPAWMGVIPLEKIYSFQPMPEGLTSEQARHVLGAECNVWTERIPPERLDYQLFPRLCALAEVTWTPAELRIYDDFTRRMATHYRRLDALEVGYFKPPSP